MLGQNSLATNLNLPDQIIKDISLIMVNRSASTPDSFMITEEIVGATSPGKVYKVTALGLCETKKTAPNHKALASLAMHVPNHVAIKGEWLENIDREDRSANILGGFGVLKYQNKTLAIPVAESTKENLLFYGAKLLDFNDELVIDANRPLPICTMNIGEKYVEDYLLKESLGHGFYLEYHDMPHFHMPLDENSKGYLILGKKAEDNILHLSAFSIPFGKAIYTPGNIIHDDAMLIGKYQVIYSVTENFSTVIVTSPGGLTRVIAVD